jgi:hypothetical protein
MFDSFTKRSVVVLIAMQDVVVYQIAQVFLVYKVVTAIQNKNISAMTTLTESDSNLLVALCVAMVFGGQMNLQFLQRNAWVGLGVLFIGLYITRGLTPDSVRSDQPLKVIQAGVAEQTASLVMRPYFD